MGLCVFCMKRGGMEYTIRDLQTYEEMLAIHKLQQEIWGLEDPMMGLYPPLISTVAKNGGGWCWALLIIRPAKWLPFCLASWGASPAVL